MHGWASSGMHSGGGVDSSGGSDALGPRAGHMRLAVDNDAAMPRARRACVQCTRLLKAMALTVTLQLLCAHVLQLLWSLGYG